MTDYSELAKELAKPSVDLIRYIIEKHDKSIIQEIHEQFKNGGLNRSEPSQDDTTDKEIKSKYTTIHEALEAAKNTKTVRYKVKGARMICDTCEYKDYSTDELPCSRCTPDSRSYREAKREPSQDDLLKEVATEFYYFWHNAPGTNTQQGFDDWWEINRARFIGK